MHPEELSVERHDVFLPRLPGELDGFTIALLSDFHYGAYVDRVLKSAVQACNRAQPDLVLLGGDFVTWHRDNVEHLKRDAYGCCQVLSSLRSRCGIFAVLGNHDYAFRSEVVTESLDHHGITLLRNSAVALSKSNRRLWIGGIDDALEGRPDLTRTLRGIPAGEPRILLAHEPDYADTVSRQHRVDLQLSGHSHGGQIRLPLVGATVLPSLAWKYPMGFYRVNDMPLYTNRGIGMSGPLVRLDCPPELTIFTLRAGSRSRPPST